MYSFGSLRSVELALVNHCLHNFAIILKRIKGKSTLALSLLRMIEASEGSITSVHDTLLPKSSKQSYSMDGIDISKLGLEDLRTRVVSIFRVCKGVTHGASDNHKSRRIAFLWDYKE